MFVDGYNNQSGKEGWERGDFYCTLCLRRGRSLSLSRKLGDVVAEADSLTPRVTSGQFRI